MPIRFACHHCGQKLSVGSQRAGTKANCPRCKELVRVPEAGSRASLTDSLRAPTQPESRRETEWHDHDMPPIPHDDESSDLVVDNSSEGAASGQVVTHVDYGLVSIPRYVLYSQALALTFIALVCFALGALMGGSFFSRGPAGPVETACTISGFVQMTEGVEKKPDAGAVVILLPGEGVQKLDEKAPVDGFRPQDSEPGQDHKGLTILKLIDGCYVRADKDGKYQARVPRPGKYLVLVISRAKQGAKEDVKPLELLLLDRFFENPAELIGSQRYKLSEEQLSADRKFDVSFE